MLSKILTVAFTVAVLLVQTACLAQTIEGLLINADDKCPIPYANIGIINSPIGTISNPDGTFEITIPEKYLNDSILFAALGFERKSYLVSSILHEKKLKVYLEEQSTVLKNVTVKSRKLKPSGSYELGNRSYNVGSFFADSIAAGSAMALLIENRYPTYFQNLTLPYFISKARLRISYNTFDNFKVRIRFLTVDSITGLPDKDIINESIIASSGMRKGWLTFDLSKYKIRIRQDRFYLVFEWLIDDEDRLELIEQYQEFKRLYPKLVTTDSLDIDGEKITFTSWHGFRAGTSFGSSSTRFAVDNYKCYYRKNSYGKWKRSSFILTGSVTILNYN